jgi:uracil-DNA glycosylase
MTVSDWNPLHGTDWDPLLGQEFEKEYWTCLQRCLEQERSCYNVYPPRDEVFAALRLTQCSETKVVIVGQDPYHGAGQAHGLAFSVPREVSVPRTLRIIYQELQDDLRVGISNQGNLEPWARRGVLLVNAVLTVREGAPRSHRRMGWETFTDEVLRVVDEKAHPVFILWGKDAQGKKTALINTPPERIIESPHPSPQSAATGFFGSKPFSHANLALIAAGREGIDWRLTE